MNRHNNHLTTTGRTGRSYPISGHNSSMLSSRRSLQLKVSDLPNYLFGDEPGSDI
jgi:hypothetical protein